MHVGLTTTFFGPVKCQLIARPQMPVSCRCRIALRKFIIEAARRKEFLKNSQNLNTFSGRSEKKEKGGADNPPRIGGNEDRQRAVDEMPVMVPGDSDRALRCLEGKLRLTGPRRRRAHPGARAPAKTWAEVAPGVELLPAPRQVAGCRRGRAPGPGPKLAMPTSPGAAARARRARAAARGGGIAAILAAIATRGSCWWFAG